MVVDIDSEKWPVGSEVACLTLEEKVELAARLRQYIIKYTAKNGGHLSSNLGVVELTIALLSTYDIPRDSVVFDVGHQSYSWKILTGRAEEFRQLRQEGGLSGFPKTEESGYDSFNTGHSSTSLSAASGLARARKLRGEPGEVVAVIGDGAISGGMAYEAINDICQENDNIVVVLNDNQMSIEQVVGGMSRHLEYLRVTPRYLSLKSRWLDRFNRVPLLGKPIVKIIEAFKSAGRKIIHSYRGYSSMFERLGFRYYGPIDGHDIRQLERYLRSARSIKGPVLLHVITQKGKGYSFAEASPSDYHGVAPFEIDLGLNNATADNHVTSWSQVFGSEIVAMAEDNPLICAISAAMTSGTGLLEFESRFPERFFDVGIAEQHALTLAAGLAMGGMRPYVALYSTFFQRGMDQLIHDICLQNLPVTITLDRAGAVGSDGETHQGIFDLPLTLALPNLEIFAPATESDLRTLLRQSQNMEGPVLIRYPKENARQFVETGFIQGTELDPYAIREVRRGESMAVIALGTMVFPALEAADYLFKKGINIGIFSVISAKPTNIHAIMCIANNYDRLLFIEDGIKESGWGEGILAQLAGSEICFNSESLGILYPLAGQAERSGLLNKSGLDAKGIISKVEALHNIKRE